MPEKSAQFCPNTSDAVGFDKLIFLHIPKTAGQTLRHVFEKHLGADACAPVLVNEQWGGHDIADLDRYKFFSGHHDIDRFDLLSGRKGFFTMLRRPLDRIASFYFFLRKQADALSDEQLAEPSRAGLRMAKTYSPDEYFAAPDIEGRQFIDAHFDNFYLFYFAGGRFMSRAQILAENTDGTDLRASLKAQAQSRLEALNLVGCVEHMPEFESAFEQAFGMQLKFTDTYVNTNDMRMSEEQAEVPKTKADMLMQLDMKDYTRQRLLDFCAYDDQLYEQFCKQ